MCNAKVFPANRDVTSALPVGVLSAMKVVPLRATWAFRFRSFSHASTIQTFFSHIFLLYAYCFAYYRRIVRFVLHRTFWRFLPPENRLK